MVLLSSDSLPTGHSYFPANFNLVEYNSMNKVNDDTLLTDASKEIVLEVNEKKTKYMLLSYHQNARAKS
jgi:hypothetical protein